MINNYNYLYKRATRYNFDFIYDLINISNLKSLSAFCLIICSLILSKHYPYKSKVANYVDEPSTISYKEKTSKSKPSKYSIVKVNSGALKTSKQVAAEYVGINNFIALAAEMEGFRGDLHKDPAYGLNIGFGYNITQRYQSSPNKMTNELKNIGLNDKIIKEIILISKAPQSKLDKHIEDFNRKHKLEDNNLINIEQGVRLLSILQNEYKLSAERVFGSSFGKMNKNQQDVLTYAAYKAGEGNLLKYKDAVRKANNVFVGNHQPTLTELRTVANELSFYYKKDGKSLVLDKRATLIANSFIHQDYLSMSVGRKDKVKNSKHFLNNNMVVFQETKKIKPKKTIKKV